MADRIRRSGSRAEDLQQPFKAYRVIFEQETRQAVEELKRPAHGLFISGLLAGFGMGVSVLFLAVLMTEVDDPTALSSRVFLANAYTIGFLIVIMARLDLFTEYTTIAIFPVLIGRATTLSLARLWGLVFVANLVGGALFAAAFSVLGQPLHLAQADSLHDIAVRLVDHEWWVILLSAGVAGWLMGMLSWLVTAARETISQAFFVWLVTFAIGFGHLHHVVLGAIEVMVAMTWGAPITLARVLHFLSWTTLGNALGGLLFATLIRYSLLLRGSGKDVELRETDD